MSAPNKCPYCGQDTEVELYRWLTADILQVGNEDIQFTAGEAFMMTAVLEAYPDYASKLEIGLEMWKQEWRFPDCWMNQLSVYATRIRPKLPDNLKLYSKTGPYSLGYRAIFQNGESVPERGTRNPEA